MDQGHPRGGGCWRAHDLEAQGPHQGYHLAQEGRLFCGEPLMAFIYMHPACTLHIHASCMHPSYVYVCICMHPSYTCILHAPYVRLHSLVWRSLLCLGASRCYLLFPEPLTHCGLQACTPDAPGAPVLVHQLSKRRSQAVIKKNKGTKVLCVRCHSTNNTGITSK